MCMIKRDMEVIHKWNIWKFFCSFLSGWKIDLEYAKRKSDVQAVNWKEKVCDRVFLAVGRPLSPNTSKSIDHSWKWHRLWRLCPVLGCLFRVKWDKLWRSLSTWQTTYRCGRALSPVPARLSFRQCTHAFTTLQSLCYNCERDACLRSWCAKVHSTMSASYTIRPS
jgi:hypothetical protein